MGVHHFAYRMLGRPNLRLDRQYLIHDLVVHFLDFLRFEVALGFGFLFPVVYFPVNLADAYFVLQPALFVAIRFSCCKFGGLQVQRLSPN